MLRRWWLRLFPREKSVLALRDLLREPDEAALSYPEGHPLAGQSRRARITRPGYDVADAEKLRLKRAPVIALADRKERIK